MLHLESALLTMRDIIMERNPGKTEVECIEQFDLCSALIERLRETEKAGSHITMTDCYFNCRCGRSGTAFPTDCDEEDCPLRKLTNCKR